MNPPLKTKSDWEELFRKMNDLRGKRKPLPGIDYSTKHFPFVAKEK